MNKKHSINSINQILQNRKMILISNVYTSCSKKHKWSCLICKHIWEALPANVIHKKSGCPKCAGQCQSIETMYELAKSCGLEFLSNSFKTVKTKYKWKCKNGHISLITADCVQSGKRCSYCHRGIREEECRFILENLTGHKFPVGRINRLELDGYCLNLNLAFEYNGEQHYKFVPYFQKVYANFEKQLKRDKEKTAACLKSNINKIDIPYFEATDRCFLTKFIANALNNLGIGVKKNNIKWKNFYGKRKFLEETINNAELVNAICLSKIYITAKTKLEFQCKNCKHRWWSTPSNIQIGHGCIKCSYKYKRWETRRNKELKLTHG